LNFHVLHRSALTLNRFDTIFLSILKCFHIAHFTIHFIVNSNISWYILSTKTSVHCLRMKKSTNWIIVLLFVEFDHQIIRFLWREYHDKSLWYAVFNTKKCDDNDFINHVLTSKAMLRIFVWRAIQISRFESNSWIAFFLFRRKTWNEITNMLIDDFVNQIRF
jgi:hypothetical protein